MDRKRLSRLDGLDGSGIRSKIIFEINTVIKHALLLVDITFKIVKYKKKQFFLNR